MPQLGTLGDLCDDIAANQLPQVSWIVAPYKYCEHPEASRTDGAYYINLVLESLTSNPGVWSKNCVLHRLDENDGLFDHVVPSIPPRTQSMNASHIETGQPAQAIQQSSRHCQSELIQ